MQTIVYFFFTDNIVLYVLTTSQNMASNSKRICEVQASNGQTYCYDVLPDGTKKRIANKNTLVMVDDAVQKTETKDTKDTSVESDNFNELILKKPSQLFPPVKLISGPITLTKHIGVLDGTVRQVYIFGDEHIKKSTCPEAPSIQRIIEETLLSCSDLPIDIYLEIPYKGSRIAPVSGQHDTWLNEVHMAFEACMQPIKTGRESTSTCRFPNARFHYVDIRPFGKISPVHEPLTIILQDASAEPFDIANAMSDLWDWMYGAFLEEWKSSGKTGIPPASLIRDLIREPDWVVDKVNKQMQFVKNEYTREMVARGLSTRVVDLSLAAQGYYELLRILTTRQKDDEDPTKYEDGEYKRYLRLADEIRKMPVTQLNAVLISSINQFLTMDLYAMFRMLRTFPAARVAPSAVNLLIFAGEKHCMNYRRVYESLGLKLIKEARSEGYILAGSQPPRIDDAGFQCLKVGDWPQPFFLKV